MPSLLWRGCAYVRTGAWSYLLSSKQLSTLLFLQLSGCYLTATSTKCTIICLTITQRIMKKLFTMMLLCATVVCFYSCGKEDPNVIDEPKIVDVCFGVKFESGNMSRATAEDVYQDFYNKHIVTKELVRDDYKLTIKDESGIAVAEINGYWDITTIQLPIGKYKVTGTSNGGSGNYSIVSLKFDEIIEVESSGTIALTVIYDCFLLLFPMNNGSYSYEYVYEVYNSSDVYNDLPTIDDLAYMFMTTKTAIDYIIYNDGTDRCKLSLESENFNFQKGCYYYFNIVTGTFNIPPMENGGI